jgi:hypothetical protein
MMATEIRLRHPATGEERLAYEGYSWTSLFFGGIPALLRGDIVLGLAIILASLVMAFAGVASGLPAWLGSAVVDVIWAAVYNGIHLGRLRRAGYQIVSRAPSPPQSN